MGLVVIVGIAALGLLSMQINGLLGGMFSAGNPTSRPPIASFSAFSAASGGNTLQITTQNGQLLEIQNYPQSLSDSPETLGANGTEKLSALLQELANKLGPEGLNELTADEAALLRALSNSGFGGAKLQRNLERSFQEPINQGATSSTFQLFDYDTNPPTSVKLSPINTLRFINRNSELNRTLKDFLETKQFKNPALQTLVSDSVNKISSNLTASAEYLTAQANHGFRDRAMSESGFHNTIANRIKTIEKESTNICEANDQNRVQTLTCIKHNG
jgi:hypothetical protein